MGRIAVTGASGLIGGTLVPALRSAGYDVLTLVRREPRDDHEVGWDPATGAIDASALEGSDGVVHLAGATIGRRWTPTHKREILESRTEGTGLLAQTLASLARPPAVLVTASGIGYYGDRGDEELTEESSRGEGFLAEVAQAWETAADPAREAGIRVVHLRQGIVLSRRGGALAKLLTPFRLGLGGRVGSGRQWWSYLSLDDAVAAYLHALTSDLSGPVNSAAPGLVTNATFTKALGRALGRPTVFPLPAVAVRLALGEMGEETLLGGQRAHPMKLLESGFRFAHADIDSALAAALAR